MMMKKQFASEGSFVHAQTWYSKWLSQFKLILWKNYRVALRNKRGTLAQLLSSFVFILLLFLFQQSIESTDYMGDVFDVVKHQNEMAIGNIPLCVVGPRADRCYTFLYAPQSDPEVMDIVKRIRDQNSPPIPESSTRGFDTADEIDEFLYSFPNTTQGAYLFNFRAPNASLNETLRSLSYILQINTTDNIDHGIVLTHQDRIMMPMQYAVERALMQHATQNASSVAKYNVTLLKFPHLAVESINIIGDNGPTFIFACLIVNFVISLGQIVAEKEFKLRESMKIMGLYDSAYWCAWFVTMSLFNTMSVFGLIIFGCIFQFDVFLRNAFGLYFFALELFALTLVSLAMLASTLVKKADTATSLGFGMFFIGFFLQYGAAIIFQSDGNQGVKNVFSLLSPCLLQVALSNLGAAATKNSSHGLSWNDVNKPENTLISALSFAELYGWLILDFFLYMFIALYLDNVLPNEYGTRRTYYYFLTPSYWTGKKAIDNKNTAKLVTTDEEYKLFDEDVKEEEEQIFHDKLPKNTAVVLKNLCKIYTRPQPGCCAKAEQFAAVKDLCLSIEENTLLCLLGPNGAGKTTTIHMLVGFHEATAGDATIFGYSIRDQMDQIQSFMGLCPQFDILWNELTGEEHLRLFAGLRNLPKEQINAEVRRLLEEVSLTEDAHTRTASYSGGMRRRLSVAIALIGNPKIVILDEPTTGMDPVSRREVWNVIESAKKNRVILLTTHSMEEADVLGDKIAIVAKGRLQCVGSALHLKQKFGAGYTITVGTKESKVKEVQDFFTKNLKGARLASPPLAGYMSYAVSRESNEELIPFFKQLHSRSAELAIEDCQLSITTLEEVFLKIAENSEEVSKYDKVTEETEEELQSYRETAKDMKATTANIREKFSLWDQFTALFMKTALLQARDRRTNICQAATPFVFICLLLLFQLLIENLVDVPDIKEVRHPEPYLPFHMLAQPGESSLSIGAAAAHLTAIGGAKLIYSSLPTVNQSLLGSYPDGIGILGQVEPAFTGPIPTRFRFYDGSPLNTDSLLSSDPYPIPADFQQSASKEEMENTIFSAHNQLPYLTGGYYFKTLDFATNTFDLAVVYNQTLSLGEDMPRLMNTLTNAIAKSLGEPVRIVLEGVKPMPSHPSGGIKPDIIANGGTIAYCLILHQLLPVFMSNIVSEKESKIKELMKMTGLKLSLYWLVHYIFDYLLYLVVTAIMIISGEILSVRFFTINEFGTYYVLFLLWGHVLVALSFLLSIFFGSKKTSSVVGYVLVIGIGICTFVLIDNLLGDFDKVPERIRLGISVIPSCALYRGLMYLTAEVRNEGPGYKFANINNEVVNLSSVYIALTIEWIVLLLLWMYLEQVIPTTYGISKHPLFFLGFGKDKDTNAEVREDEESDVPRDVATEIEQVFNPGNENTYSVRVLGLKKTYPSRDGNPPRTAVKSVSFGVKHNSSHGILGHNGAGKTTMLNVMIGLYPSTSGSAYILGKSIHDELSSIHTMMGVCTQYDILWETLTGREHLLFFGRLRNLKGQALSEQVDLILKQFNLYEARNVVAGKYSGGMKRRLSVAIALLGRPKIIYLDEPSTGLDPKSRQRMWRVINETKETSTIILTTHSMEEADAICDRLMIMSDGEVKCIGVSADLKNRFGEGYKLSVQIAKGHDQEPADKFIKQLAPNAILLNSLSGTRNYQVPKKSVTLDQVFQAMENNKQALHITDWAITNTTLEEVFLSISKQHHDQSKQHRAQRSRFDETHITISEDDFELKPLPHDSL